LKVQIIEYKITQKRGPSLVMLYVIGPTLWKGSNPKYY